ncbi:MAG: NAD(P)/FAD-dependent oxidoreductase [Lachnospiraceae bacterium]|nr:NAD(P)/FAD-dependent oxidoreductase [Lachnospiraceae bacterium]
MKKQVLVIGGGAAGLTAAIWAVKSGAKAVIIEHTDRVGKKLLSTGNGRCNLTNSKMDHTCYHCSDSDFPMQAIQAFGWKDTLRWFSSMGVLCKSRMETYYYPMSEQASAVLDALRLECNRLKVEIITDCQPKEIKVEKKKGRTCFQVSTNQGLYQGDSLILACGSKAAPNTGSDGTGYELAKAFGHRIIKPLPALVQLRCQGSCYKSLAGIRTDANLTLYINGRAVCEERGELQLTDYGISGIPVFQLSRFAARALDEGKKVQVQIDFLPFMDMEESRLFLKQRLIEFKDWEMENLLTGVINKKLAKVLLKLSGIPSEMPAFQVSRKQQEKLLNELKAYEGMVSSVNPFANAQVCCGGIAVSEVNSHTMESMLVPGLFFAGEILDVDGICGGYNLQWAWSSGKMAGTQAAQWKEPGRRSGGTKKHD